MKSSASANRAAHAYYVLDDPNLPDSEYDRLLRALEALEAAHPELISANSPCCIAKHQAKRMPQMER